MGNCFSSTPLPTNNTKKTFYLILPYSNPINFRTRENLLKQTVKQLQSLHSNKINLEITVCQLVYDNQTPLRFNQNDLVFKTTRRNVLWSKENLINLAISDIIKKKPDAQYFAWIDADIRFDSVSILENAIDVMDSQPLSMVQLFSEAILEGENHTVKSFGYQLSMKSVDNYSDQHNKHPDYWHPGFAWATTRQVFLLTNGLVEHTLGSADRHMSMALIGKVLDSVPNELLNTEYSQMLLDWQHRALTHQVKLLYVKGRIYHSYHGSLQNRQYMGRWGILIKHNFAPSTHLKRDEQGLIVWSDFIDDGICDDVYQYFKQRDEDEPPLVHVSQPTYNHYHDHQQTPVVIQTHNQSVTPVAKSHQGKHKKNKSKGHKHHHDSGSDYDSGSSGDNTVQQAVIINSLFPPMYAGGF